MIHCCIFLDFFNKLYSNARIHEHQIYTTVIHRRRDSLLSECSLLKHTSALNYKKTLGASPMFITFRVLILCSDHISTLLMVKIELLKILHTHLKDQRK